MGNFDFKAIESKWQKYWDDNKIYRTTNDPGKKKLYCLDFFPYPSGSGLSVGHCRNYVPSDVYSRYFRMIGYNVLHPMGWDSFGLPAENYAIQMGIHPEATTAKNTANYKRQMTLIGTSYDWEREINSSDPDYYKWTQWFFLLLFERGLAYQNYGAQWWCPECKTVLANEQAEGGVCWRCGSQVERKDLKQWFFKITDYADRLEKDLETIDWPEPIKIMQRNWIGRSEGAKIIFKSEKGRDIVVFTTRPDTLFGCTYMVLAPEHELVPELTTPEQKNAIEAYIKEARKASDIDRLSTDKEKTGVFTGSYAINPANGKKVPIWIGDYVLATYGTGAIMCVPAHDERDFAFAKKFGLPVVQVISKDGGLVNLENAYTEPGTMVNSGQYDGMDSEKFKKVLVEELGKKGIATPTVNYKLRDWLISRQRYWGAPIPVIHCEKCGTVAVPKDQLPVKLPHIDKFEPSTDGKSPLAKIPEFVNTTCPKCGGPAQRETDTMDGFACSSWYFLRFPNPHENDRPFNPEMIKYWLPVNVYVGGAEHAVMHLIYARFWTKVMHDAGLISFIEPFQKLMNQGMVLGGDHQKMSKSKGNVVTPDSMVEKYGADALRGYILFMGPFEGEVVWDEPGCAGVYRFLGRVFDNFTSWKYGNISASEQLTKELTRIKHKLILKVTSDIERFHFNTAISSFMEAFNSIYDLAKTPGTTETKEFRDFIENYIVLLAPFCPYITEEIWELLGNKASVHQQPWPVGDETLTKEDTINIPIQINGKLRHVIQIQIGTSEEEIQKIALSEEQVKKFTDGHEILKIMVPKGKLVSIVIK
ncbi:MAG TPA: leucine--tRNA ligase [Caldisericia bacterium]|nr:leucine--tRNA ligase [Caldisericia bacterium]HOU08234.1 leucine--tRNA ligase [Caldisericia bacterium]HPL89198.1 leucine--tRNA ligase [Caldisericia bacterium]HQG58866.1 leucine--tRNA ligase [Caldisericia bacterium]HQH48798.1 leucine--tRNA ligase [Caldisericia bacterium]